jgi:SAM-dependent methyltransferase
VAVPAYRVWWRLRGLDFGVVSVSELGLDTEHAKDHKDGGGPLLDDLLRQLDIAESDAALDLGSGKGGAMATLATYPFRIVDGVEISPTLADVARANLAKLKLTKCRVIQADAATFTDLDEYTHIFMYNPFSAAILEQVISNLSGSLSRRPRPVRVVYSNPLHEDVIVGSGQFTRSFVYQPYLEYRICVYQGRGLSRERRR